MDIIIEMIPHMIKGLFVTLNLLIQSAFFGLLITIPIVLGRMSKFKVIRYLVNIYIVFFRGTPLLVQFFIFYYGFAQFEWFRDSIFWFMFKPAMSCAILTLAMNTAAYTAEILYGAMRSIPKGDIEAARALGMSRFLIIRRIMLPKAIAYGLPAYGNEVIYLLKGTAIVFMITILDLMGMANLIRAQTFLTYEPLIIAAIFYLLITFALTKFFKWMESKYRIE